MSTITIPIEDEDLQYLKNWTREQGTTLEEFFAKEARSLRKHLEAPLHPALLQASGVISRDIDAKDKHLEYLMNKHK